MAVSGDHNIKGKETDKLKKYTDLQIKSDRMSHIPTTVVLFIIVHLVLYLQTEEKSQNKA